MRTCVVPVRCVRLRLGGLRQCRGQKGLASFNRTVSARISMAVSQTRARMQVVGARAHAPKVNAARFGRVSPRVGPVIRKRWCGDGGARLDVTLRRHGHRLQRIPLGATRARLKRAVRLEQAISVPSHQVEA